MKRKQFLALALVLTVAAGAAGATSFVSEASTFRQAKTAEEVNYGTLTEKQLSTVNEYFDAGFYATKYPDVAEKVGTDKEALLSHFVNCGVFEGRMGWSTYDPEALGMVICFNEFVDVEIYAASNLMGTADYKTVNAAAQSAANNGASIVTADGVDYIIASEDVAEAILAANDTTEAKKAEVHYEKLGSISVNGDFEAVIIVYRTATGYGTTLQTDMTQVTTLTDIVGFVPAIAMSVEEGNSIIDGEYGYAIEKFETESGVVIGTEGVTFTSENDVIYYQPDELETPHKRIMTNYIDTGYVDNAPIGIDENGENDAEYTISAAAEADENGDAVVTAVITNEGTDYEYKVTYTFDGTPKSEKAEAAATAEAESDAETVVEE